MLVRKSGRPVVVVVGGVGRAWQRVMTHAQSAFSAAAAVTVRIQQQQLRVAKLNHFGINYLLKESLFVKRFGKFGAKAQAIKMHFEAIIRSQFQLFELTQSISFFENVATEKRNKSLK